MEIGIAMGKTIITARGSDDSIVLSIFAKIFLMTTNAITHEPLHLA